MSQIGMYQIFLFNKCTQNIQLELMNEIQYLLSINYINIYFNQINEIKINNQITFFKLNDI